MNKRNRSLRRWRLLGTMGICTALVVLLSAAASPADPLVRVSQGDLFAHCPPPADAGTVYRGAEVTTSLAVDPLHSATIIATYEQDPLSTQAALGAVAAASPDGGQSWRYTALPFTACAPNGAPYPRTHKPVVSIGADGTAYALSLSYDDTSSASAVLVVTSSDGGQTWSPVRTVARYPAGSTHSIYKTAWITADPTTPGTAYAVWEDLSEQGEHFFVPAMFSKTTDGGRSWSTPIPIAAKGRDEQADTNNIVVDSLHHRIYDFYPYFYCVCYTTPEVAYVYSTDGGRTWSGQHVISDLLNSLSITAPGGTPVHPAYGPVETMDPQTGQLYVAWLDNRYTGESFDQVVVTTSVDLGRHWSPPHVVHTPHAGPASYSPALAVSGGVLGVTFQTYTRGRTADEPDSQYWFATSTDGTNFRSPVPASPSFGLGNAPTEDALTPGPFLGDYQALVATDTGFLAGFAMTTCREGCATNPTDVLTEKLPR